MSPNLSTLYYILYINNLSRNRFNRSYGTLFTLMASLHRYSSDEELSHCLRAEQHFFSPDRIGNSNPATRPTSLVYRTFAALAKWMTETRKLETALPATVAGYGARLLISADATAVEATWQLPHSAPREVLRVASMRTRISPVKASPPSVEVAYLQGLSHPEFVLGVPNAGRLHKGNCLIEGLGTYPAIADRIQAIMLRECPPGTESVRIPHLQQCLAALILQFAQSMEKVERETRFQDGTGKDSCVRDHFPAIADEDLDFLTRLCFLLTVKEPSRRRHPEGPSQPLPWATSIMRGLKLASVGRIPLLDLFALAPGAKGRYAVEPDTAAQYGGEWGPFSGQKLDDRRDQVVAKMKAINRLFLETFPEYTTEGARVRLPLRTSTYERLHRELGNTLGEGDSDGEAFKPPSPMRVLFARATALRPAAAASAGASSASETPSASESSSRVSRVAGISFPRVYYTSPPPAIPSKGSTSPHK